MTFDWKYKIIRVKEILADRRSLGIPKASIRSIFYNLVSLDLVPNVKGAYKQPFKALVTAREKGFISDDWFADKSRNIKCLKMIDISKIYVTCVTSSICISSKLSKYYCKTLRIYLPGKNFIEYN